MVQLPEALVIEMLVGSTCTEIVARTGTLLDARQIGCVKFAHRDVSGFFSCV